MPRAFLILLIAAASLLIAVPAYAADAGTPAGFFGPIVPAECNCESEGSAPGFGCLLAVLNNLVVFAVSIGVIIIVLVIAYAGFLFMFTAANPENRSQAKKMFWNAVIGLAIVLGSWLIVNTLLGALGAGGVESTTSGLAGGSQCIKKEDTPTGTPGGPVITPGPGGEGNNCPAADPSTMVAFPAEATSGATEYATQAIVNNFLALRAAALADGVDIKVVDGYRSDAEQVQLWYQNGQNTKVVARPCSLGGGGSNHNSGLALDLTVGCGKSDSSCNSPQYQWLREHAGQWNFYNDLPQDIVHWSPTGH